MRLLAVLFVVLAAVALVPTHLPTFTIAISRDDPLVSFSRSAEAQARERAYWEPRYRDVRHTGYPARTTIDPFRPVRVLFRMLSWAGWHIEAHLEGVVADLVAATRGTLAVLPPGAALPTA